MRKDSNLLLAKQLRKMKSINIYKEQTMTSLEIAELTGKQHKDVMKAIRNMEPAWEKVCGRNFALTSRTIVQPNGGTREVPCYSLTKTECLYIATKFNDEARARLRGLERCVHWGRPQAQIRKEQASLDYFQDALFIVL
jgi:hypothetical protein